MTMTTTAGSAAGAAPPSPPSCDAAGTYVLFHAETQLPNWGRAVLYAAALAYCFVGLSAITARFFKSMETIVKQTREVTVDDDEGPCSNDDDVKKTKKKKREEKVWNYAVADVALLAFGTSFPQISLAVVDAIRNLGQPTAGGLGPGTLVGSAAFDLFPIHAVCVVMPRAGSMKKISDLGVWLVELFWSFWAYIWLYIILEVWTPRVITLSEALLTVLQYGLLLLHAYAQDKRWPYVSIPLARGERPEDWVPEEEEEAQDSWVDYDDEISETLPLSADASACSRVEDSSSRVDIFVGHSYDDTAEYYHSIPEKDDDVEGSSSVTIMNGAAAVKKEKKKKRDDDASCWISIWRRQFVDAVTLESPASRKMDSAWLRFAKICGNLTMAPWRLTFALVPPHHVAHGWVAFACSLTFISAVAYGVTRLTDGISCATGISPYVIAFTALAAGTSWPDLVASKIAAERQVTADSALANITCSNSVNIYVGIGVPWLINTAYNYFFNHQQQQEPLRVDNADGLSFSLLVYFATSFGCVAVLVLRRVVLGAELGGPRVWAWVTSAYFMLLWVVFVVLSSLRFSDVI